MGKGAGMTARAGTGFKNQYIKREEVEAELRQLVRTAKKMGLWSAHYRWILEPGSRVYKTDWRLWMQNPDGPGHVPLGFLDNGFIGKNGPEALHTLKSIRMAWEYLLTERSKIR
jgi:hypothetical protein